MILLLQRAGVIAAMLVLLAVPAAGKALAGAEVIDVRFGVDASGRTRIVLDIEQEPHYRATLKQAADGTKQLLVEVDQGSFNVGGNSIGNGEGIGHIGQYAFTATADNLATLRFNLAETSVPQAVFLIKPKGNTPHYRIVVDMADASEAVFVEQLTREYGPMRGGDRLKPSRETEQETLADAGEVVGEPAPVAEDMTSQMASAAVERAKRYASAHSVPVPSVKPNVIRRQPAPQAVANRERRIIIDAGHGGKDPGAIGAGGTYEKNVTLAAAKTLEAILKKRGYDVVMTRTDDTKVSFEDRMPRRSKDEADLFISIHADSIENSEVRGASVYTLSKRGGLRLANQIERNKQKGDTVVGGVDLANVEGDLGKILADLSTDRAQEYSALFADILVENMSDRVAMVANSHRQENLIVLLAPDIPAVLLELGFMSNIHDEANLTRPEWRNGAMTIVADSIDTYFERHFTSRHVRLTEGAR